MNVYVFLTNRIRVHLWNQNVGTFIQHGPRYTCSTTVHVCIIREYMWCLPTRSYVFSFSKNTCSPVTQEHTYSRQHKNTYILDEREHMHAFWKSTSILLQHGYMCTCRAAAAAAAQASLLDKNTCIWFDQNMYSCSTRTHMLVFKRSTCSLVHHQHMHYHSTRTHVALLRNSWISSTFLLDWQIPQAQLSFTDTFTQLSL